MLFKLCCLEAVRLNYLNRRLILTLTSSYSNRNFKLIKVSGVITIHSNEFLHVINNDKKNNDQKYRCIKHFVHVSIDKRYYGGPEGSHMQIKKLLQIKNSTCKLKIVHAN